MKTLILSIFLLGSFAPQLNAQYQFNLMDDFLQIGAGNYFIHLDKEAEVKKVTLLVKVVYHLSRLKNQTLKTSLLQAYS